jgi:hypothetical protein
MVFGLFALATAAIFFGAAFYVNFAEQSARLNLDDRQTGVWLWLIGALFWLPIGLTRCWSSCRPTIR